jgi:hypothetical protein
MKRVNCSQNTSWKANLFWFVKDVRVSLLRKCVSEYGLDDTFVLNTEPDPWQCFEVEIRGSKKFVLPKIHRRCNDLLTYLSVGDADIHNRGCVRRTHTEENTCASANDGLTPQYCRLCDSDGCNSGSVTTISAVMLISSFVLALKNV